jgi:hypothetical protein
LKITRKPYNRDFFYKPLPKISKEGNKGAMCEKDDRKKRPSPRAFFTNLQVDMPWMEKAKLLVKNNLIKVTKGQNCCGHPGEQGC